ncbi:MAG: serine/threonine protein kinase [Planctomycetota bacterium]|nr:MAG: serine/threonine protein kinase [Planctomycetota bacterium]
MAPGEAESTDARAELKQLVAEALERAEDEGSRVVDELCARHPQHAAALRRRLELLLGSGLGPIEAPREFPEALGDFRLHERLGQGGMGVVYRATQVSLGREVALKLIRPEQLYFSGARERFRREVEIVARLQHPGIVAVHAVGEEQGVPYFAMELVRGASLAELIARLQGRAPSALSGADLARALGAGAPGGAAAPLFDGDWARTTLCIAIEMCRALEHAHAQGVLHRDLKPSNCMLTADGRVLLLDFGLALQQGASELTRSGSALGSLPYMAPEQVDGRIREIDERTDVYGVGVTLYELATLQQPFLEPVTELTRARILAGKRVGPRTLQPQLSRDAEVVCLTALDADRGRRYATVRALRADLERALHGEPIAARAPNSLELGWRWIRRYPAASAALALLLLAAVGVPALLSWQQALRARQAESALEDLRSAERITQQQRSRAEENLERAVGAIDALLAHIDDPNGNATPELTPVRTKALAEAQRFLAEFRAHNTESEELDLATARVELRVGRLQANLASAAAARPSLEDALPKLARHVALRPDDLVLALADGYLHLGATLADLGALQLAEVEFSRALEMARRLLARTENRGPIRATIASAAQRLTSLYSQTGRPELARAAYSEGLREVRAEWELRPDEYERRSLLAEMLWRSVDLGDPALQRSGIDEALTITRELFAERPRDARTRGMYAMLLGARAAGGQLEFEQARADGAHAVSLLEDLVTEEPGNLRTRSFLANQLLQCGTYLARAGRGPEAREPLLRGVEELEHLVEQAPDQIDHRVLLAYTLDYLAYVEDADPLAALPYLKRAFDAACAALDISSDRRDARDQFAFCARRLAYCLQTRLDRSADALELVSAAEQRSGSGAQGRLFAASLLADWIRAELHFGRRSEQEVAPEVQLALHWLGQARSAGEVDVAALRADATYQALCALPGFELVLEPALR